VGMLDEKVPVKSLLLFEDVSFLSMKTELMHFIIFWKITNLVI
jgi:hypothetical protein